MNGDKPKLSFVDRVFSETSTLSNKLQSGFSIIDDANLDSLEILRQGEHNKQTSNRTQSTLNFDNGTITHDLPFKRGEPTSPLEDKTKAFLKRNQLDNRLVNQIENTQGLIQDVKDIGRSSSLANSLSKGLWQGLGQNLDLLTGFTDEGQGKNAYNLSIKDLEKLKGDGYITQDEYNKYIQKRNSLPLLTTVTASLINSVLIAGEIAYVAPKTAFSLGQQSVKFFTKEGAKLYGKEILKQGVNSYRVMGLGANIRTAVDSEKEIDARILKGETVGTDDALGIIGKNFVKNNIQAFMEGASEGMLRELRYGNVAWKNLLGSDVTTKVAKDAFKTLAKNIGKKGFSGLVMESATEQVTDITNDLLDGTANQSILLSQLYGTSEDKKQAAENLFVEAVTGLLLGHAMGMTDLWRGNIEKDITAEVKKGKISLEQGQAILDAIDDQRVLNNAINKIQKKNQIGAWSETAKSVSQSLSNFQRFGLNTNPNIQVHESEKETHDKAVQLMNENFVYNLAKVSDRLDEEVKRTGLKPNILDQSVLLGQENVITYLDARSDIEGDVDYATPFKRDDKGYNLPFEITHAVTNKATYGMMAAAPKSLVEGIKVPESLSSNQQQELKQDLTIAAMANFGDLGYDGLQAKWSKLLEDEVLDNITKVNQALHNTKTTNAGQAIMQTAFDASIKDVEQHFAQKTIEREDSRVSKNLEQLQDIESIGVNVVDGYLNQIKTDELAPNRPRKMKAVALRLPNGEIIKGEPGNIHFHLREPLMKDHTLEEMYAIDDGFIDENNIFYDREEAEMATGLFGEANAQGVGEIEDSQGQTNRIMKQLEAEGLAYGTPEFDKRLEEEIDNLPLNQRPEARSAQTKDLFPFYEESLQDFDGKTAGELFRYLKDHNLIQPELEVIFKLMQRHIKDIPVVIEDTKDGNPGTYLRKFEGGPKIIINPKVQAYGAYDLGNTGLHESLHAFTADFLASGTKEAQEFRADIDAIIKDFQSVFNDPHKAIKSGLWLGEPTQLLTAVARYGGDYKYYTANAEEFIAGIFSDTTKMRGVLMRISSLAQNPNIRVTLWDKVRHALKRAWAQELPTDKPTLFDNLIDAMSKHQENLENFHNLRKRSSTGLTAEQASNLRDAAADFHGNEYGLVPGESMKDIDLDPNQIDEGYEAELQQDLAETKGYISLLGHIHDLSVPDLRNKIKNMGSVDAFRAWLDSQDKAIQKILNTRLEELFDKSYKHKQENLKDFKERFITGAFNGIINSKSMPHVNVTTESNGETSTLRITRLGDSFRRGDGTMGDSYVGSVVLEDFIAPLEKMLGLQPKSLNMLYIAGFEQTRNGKFWDRSTLKRLTKGLLGQWESKEPTAKLLARMLWEQNLVYPGNFGGRNTTIAFELTDKAKFLAAIKPYRNAYLNKMKFSNDDTQSYGQTLRLMLEDMWYGKDISKPELVQQNSEVLKGNINKIWKRGMKFMTKKNSVWQNPEHFKQKFGNKQFTGIGWKDGELTARSATFSSDDQDNITIRHGEASITVPISTLLRNESMDGTPRTDGVTFYLLDEFDNIYHTIHGTLKDGTIKNVYASILGETPLYIKHAMHGVHPNSAIGKFMREHNIALLMSDQAVKVGAQPINLSDHWDVASTGNEIAPENVIELKIGKFQRIKEELGTDTVAGTIKQWLNGSGHGSYSSVIKAADHDGKYDEHLKNLAARIAQKANEEVDKKSTPKELYKVLKNIVESPEGPNEQTISSTYKQIMSLEEDQFMNQFGNVFNIPLISESLRQRLFRIVDSALQARIGGMRACLGPDLGIFNAPANVDPIENSYNVSKLIVNLAQEEGMLSELFPEAGLGELALEYTELQRQESIGIAGNDNASIKQARIRKEEIIDAIVKMSDAEGVSEERRKALISGNIYKAIAKSDKVEAFKAKVLKSIFNDETKTLKEGWAIISEDHANQKGIKPGDKIILEVTPTDSPLGIMAVRVAGIMPTYKGSDPNRKTSDRMRLVLNSNYIQTIVGKDYDIDTIAAISYDSNYWTKDQYEAVWETISAARTKFVDKVTATTRAVLNNNEITKESAFTGPIREAYCQKIMGPATGAQFTATDTFWELNDAYLVDPSPIITERLYHTLMSAIGLKTKVDGVPLEVVNPKWFETHLYHLIDTNFSVDFPGQTSKLTYNGMPGSEGYGERMFNLKYGLQPGQIASEERDAINKIHRFLFATAFDLAASRDTELDAKPTYYRLKKMVIKQQNILRLLQTNPQYLAADFAEKLNSELDEKRKQYGPTHEKYREFENLIEDQQLTAISYFSNLKIDDVNNYPLFAAINKIDVNHMPMPGSSFEDWLIDQSMMAEDMLESSAVLSKIHKDQILGEATGHKKIDFQVNKRSFAMEEAKGIVERYGQYVAKGWKNIPEDLRKKWNGDKLSSIDKADALAQTDEIFKATLAEVPEQYKGKFQDTIRDYSAMRSLAGKPYPVDAVRGGQDWNIMHRAIALSFLPKEVDFYNYIKKDDYQNKSQAVQAEIISILHGFGESAVKDNGDQMHLNRWSRSVSFPILFKALLDKPRVSSVPGEVTLQWNGKPLKVYTSINNTLVFQYGGQTLEHDKLKANAPELYAALTNKGNIWDGIESDDNGTKNRLEIGNLLNFSDNIKVEERLDILDKYIQNRLYSGNSKFGLAAKHAIWISMMAQSTNLGIQDKKLQNLIIRREQVDPRVADNFRANEVLYKLLSRFEPSLFNRAMNAYSEINSSEPRLDQELGIQAMRHSSWTTPLNQKRFDETNQDLKSKHLVSLLIKEVDEVQDKASRSNFKKAIKTEGYEGGLKYLRNMVKRSQIMDALASSEMWYGDLVHDLNRLTTAQFEKKYGPQKVELVYNSLKNKIDEFNQVADNFLKDQIEPRGSTLSILEGLWLQLKAVEKLASKKDATLTKLGKKLLWGEMSYPLLGPIKEKKLYAFGNEKNVIGTIFDYNGPRELTIGDFSSFNKYFPTSVYNSIGESSKAMMKSQFINTSINRFQVELNDQVQSMEDVFQLIADPKARDSYLSKHEQSDPHATRVTFLKSVIPGLGNSKLDETPWNKINQRSQSLLLHKEIFSLAENLTNEMGIQVIQNESGTMYRRGDYYEYDKYLFVNGVTNPTITLEEGQVRLKPLNLNALDKMKLLAALDIREMYDIKVPSILQKALAYIEATRNELLNSQDFASIAELDAIRERYMEYLDAIEKKSGTYMPHMFPVHTYKYAWGNEYSDYLKNMVKANYPNLKEDSSEYAEKLNQMLDEEYRRLHIGDSGNYVIPNFLPRRSPDDGYKKATLDMHYFYINHLANGLKNDLLYTDYLSYIYNARRNGERSSMIEYTKMWYGDQMNNKMLHTKPLDATDIKRGMEINFLSKGWIVNPEHPVPIESDLQVWGTVDKVTKDKVHLKLNKPRLLFEINRDLESADRHLAYLEKNELMDEPATNRQIVTIKKLLKQGYIKNLQVSLDKLTISQSIELIVEGIKAMKADIDNIGVYNISDLRTTDLRGKSVNKVNRYMRKGVMGYLDAKKREADNLRNIVAEWDNKSDMMAYGAWTAAKFSGGFALSGTKLALSLGTMGLAASPVATTANWGGGFFSNILDAPSANIKYMRQGREQYGRFNKLQRSSMSDSQKAWYDTFAALGLTNADDLVAIAMEAGNISDIDILTDEGFLGGIKYLNAAMWSGAEYGSYIKEMNRLRLKYLLASELERMTILNKMNQTTRVWQAKVEKRIKSFVTEITPTTEDIAAQAKLNPKVKDQSILTEYARSQRVINVMQAREAQIQQEKEAGTFKEETNVTNEEKLRRSDTNKLTAKYLYQHFIHGYLGLGLQATAERQRRPAYFIGKQTALDQGYTKAEAGQYGFNSIGMRHAFYGPATRQLNANTTGGGLAHQYVQYTWSNFVHWIHNLRAMGPQFLEQWAKNKQAGLNPLTNVWKALTSKTFTTTIPSKEKALTTLKDTNVLRRVMLKSMITMAFNQGSARLFYGFSNFQDPMLQLFYKMGDLITGRSPMADDDDEWYDTILQICDMMFFWIGLPYKLAMQYLISSPEDDMVDSLFKSRFQMQAELYERIMNTIDAGNIEDKLYMQAEGKKFFFGDWPWLLDRMILGFKLTGYAAPDSPSDYYYRWGYYPGLTDKFPYIMRYENRQIDIKRRPRYINTEGQGIDMTTRFIKSTIGGYGTEFIKTWLPYMDKAFSDYKKEE